MEPTETMESMEIRNMKLQVAANMETEDFEGSSSDDDVEEAPAAAPSAGSPAGAPAEEGPGEVPAEAGPAKRARVEVSVNRTYVDGKCVLAEQVQVQMALLASAASSTIGVGVGGDVDVGGSVDVEDDTVEASVGDVRDDVTNAASAVE